MQWCVLGCLPFLRCLHFNCLWVQRSWWRAWACGGPVRSWWRAWACGRPALQHLWPGRIHNKHAIKQPAGQTSRFFSKIFREAPLFAEACWTSHAWRAVLSVCFPCTSLKSRRERMLYWCKHCLILLTRKVTSTTSLWRVLVLSEVSLRAWDVWVAQSYELAYDPIEQGRQIPLVPRWETKSWQHRATLIEKTYAWTPDLGSRDLYGLLLSALTTDPHSLNTVIEFHVCNCLRRDCGDETPVSRGWWNELATT